MVETSGNRHAFDSYTHGMADFSTEADRAAQFIFDWNEVNRKGRIVPNGMIWVSWPKKASGVATDVTEDRIRDTALTNGLVDVKVCAVDAVWSGLKLVIPVKNRAVSVNLQKPQPARTE